jgi:uncharacterized protein YbjT (DUF2867 family)
MIAVMGAAGNVGGKVADRLLRGEQRVRVLAHHRRLDGLAGRGAEVVTGDAVDPDGLRALLEGAEAALVVLPENYADPEFVANRSRMSAAIADALAASRVGHVVVLSTVGAGLADAIGPPAGLRELEQRLSRLDGRNVLVLRSGFYMENLLASLPMIQSQGVNGSAIGGDVAIPMVATRDVAGEAAARLLRRDFTGHQVKLLLGPEDVTMPAATRAIGERLGLPDLPYVQFPADAVRAALAGAGMSEQAASLMVDMQQAMNQGWPFVGVRRTSEETTPTTLETFLKETLL